MINDKPDTHTHTHTADFVHTVAAFADEHERFIMIRLVYAKSLLYLHLIDTE